MQVLVAVGGHGQRQFAGQLEAGELLGGTRYSSKSLNWREPCTQMSPERSAFFSSDRAHSS
jgi:hypothetical protein